MFLVLERLGLGRLLAGLSPVIAHGYTLVVVIAGWVLFRAPTFGAGWAMLRAMAGAPVGVNGVHDVGLYWDAGVALSFGAGVVGALPIGVALEGCRRRVETSWLEHAVAAGRVLALGAVFVGCAMMLAAGTHNPFIYFRF